MVFIRPNLDKTPYDLLKGRKPNISYFRIFMCKYFILNNIKDNLSNFDAKSNEGIFPGYSSLSKAYRVYNQHHQLKNLFMLHLTNPHPERRGKVFILIFQV